MTSRACRARASSRSGQGLTEFALVLPAMLLLLLIAIDFGRLFYTYIQLNNTAREGAAYASVNPTVDSATLTTIALRESNVQSQRGETSITASAACVDSAGAALACPSAQGGAGAGNRVTVSVGEKFNFLTPLIGGFWPGGLTLHTSATATVITWAAGGGAPPPTCTTKPATPVFTWQSPDPTNHPFLISVDASTSPNQASPCQNISYEWSFGGTSNASPPDPTDPFREGITQDYEYAVGGTYTVTLVVSNGAGDSPPTTATITLGGSTCNAPIASFTISPAAIPNQANPTNWFYHKNKGPGTLFTFDGSASAFMSDPACHPAWSWSLGDGTTPAPTTPMVSHTFDHNGNSFNVDVTLTTTNDAGTSSHTETLPLKPAP